MKNGSITFGKTVGERHEGTLKKAEVSTKGHHTDYTLDLTEAGLDQAVTDGTISSGARAARLLRLYSARHIEYRLCGGRFWSMIRYIQLV